MPDTRAIHQDRHQTASQLTSRLLSAWRGLMDSKHWFDAGQHGPIPMFRQSNSVIGPIRMLLRHLALYHIRVANFITTGSRSERSNRLEFQRGSLTRNHSATWNVILTQQTFLDPHSVNCPIERYVISAVFRNSSTYRQIYLSRNIPNGFVRSVILSGFETFSALAVPPRIDWTTQPQRMMP